VISGNITNFTFFDEIALILCFQWSRESVIL